MIKPSQSTTQNQRETSGSDNGAGLPGQARANFRVMVVAVLAGVVIMILKFVGFWVSGSTAILSDALESIINVVASAFGLAGVVVASKPADETHPYGHGTIEFFSAGFEGALILIAAVGICYEGIGQILHPRDLPDLGIGALFVGVAAAGNLVLGLVLTRRGRDTKSLVLEADGKHLLTDVVTSGAVLVGLGCVYLTGWLRLDGVIACIAALNIVFWGGKLIRQALAGLMQQSDPALLDEICDLLARNKRSVWIDVHRLRAWRSGRFVHVDFHLILPSEIELEEAHNEVKMLERIFTDHFEGFAEILIHLDPCAPEDCEVCETDPCDLRTSDRRHTPRWSRTRLVVENSDLGRADARD